MEDIYLTPLQVSKILDIPLSRAIKIMCGVDANKNQPMNVYMSQKIKIEKEYKNKSFHISDIPEFKNESVVSEDLQGVCILREFIRQANKYTINTMQLICLSKSSIANIRLSGQVAFYDAILTEENKEKVLDKLADIHLYTIGEDATYKNYINKK